MEIITAVAGLASGGFGSFFLRIGLSFALSALTRGLAPKPSSSTPSISSSNSAGGGLNIAGQTIGASHKHVYGLTRHAGDYYNLGLSSDNKYLYAYSIFAAHEIDGFVEYWLGDVSITPDMLNADGLVISGAYANKLRIRPFLGSPTQVADSVVITEISGLDENFRGREIAGVFWRFEYDQNLFSSGPPNPSMIGRGKKIFDPRDSVTRFTGSLGLFKYEYLQNQRAGYAASAARFDTTQNSAQLNICE
ncbi:MAG TPA: hypothetical protein VHB73_01560, partial [Alphaproteobacteria bacterium]|nr:hypothetical protein [Alphaproteobacteria bacterium]